MPYDLLLVDVSGIAHGTVALSSQLIQMLTQRIHALSQWIAQTLPLVCHVEILVGPRCMPLILPSNFVSRSEEHRSEVQSRPHLVCRLLLEKKKKKALRVNCNWYSVRSVLVPT